MTKGKPASFTDIAFDSGRIYEQERIIKLLEERLADLLDDTEGCYFLALDGDWLYKEGLIALIKGEQN